MEVRQGKRFPLFCQNNSSLPPVNQHNSKKKKNINDSPKLQPSPSYLEKKMVWSSPNLFSETFPAPFRPSGGGIVASRFKPRSFWSRGWCKRPPLRWRGRDFLLKGKTNDAKLETQENTTHKVYAYIKKSTYTKYLRTYIYKLYDKGKKNKILRLPLNSCYVRLRSFLTFSVMISSAPNAKTDVPKKERCETQLVKTDKGRDSQSFSYKQNILYNNSLY